jgi:hypothetical protein
VGSRVFNLTSTKLSGLNCSPCRPTYIMSIRGTKWRRTHRSCPTLGHPAPSIGRPSPSCVILASGMIVYVAFLSKRVMQSRTTVRHAEESLEMGDGALLGSKEWPLSLGGSAGTSEWLVTGKRARGTHPAALYRSRLDKGNWDVGDAAGGRAMGLDKEQ